MNKFFAYISLRLKLQFGNNKGNKKSKILTLIFGLITTVVVLFLLKLFFDIISDQLLVEIGASNFSALIFTIIEVVLIGYGVSLILKHLLKPADVKITARFPLSSFQMFVAEIIIVFLYMLIMSFICYFAVMLVFAWSAEILSVAYVLRLLLVSLFAPLLPFAISLILSVPIMFILNLLENHNITKLIIFVLMFAACFVLYNLILEFLTEYYLSQKINPSSKNALGQFVLALNHDANFLVYIKNILFETYFIVDILLTLAIFILITGLGLFLVKIIYENVRKQLLEGTGKFFKKNTVITNDKGFVAIIKNEFKTIMRTHAYSYFYLGVAISTPVMVFLCDRLVGKVGESFIGGGVSYGVSMLVICAFMAMINSFSATAISRESENFYITKIAPISYKKQLTAKGIINLAVSVGALLISTIIISVMKFVTIDSAFVIFFSSLIGAFGMILNGFNINLKHPNLTKKIEGEIGEINIAKCLLIGLLFCAIQGLCGIILGYFIDTYLIYIINLGVSIIYAGINLIIFMLTADKRYSKIEYR